MSREALAWWWTFGSGVALGTVVTAVACGRLRGAQRILEWILGDVAPEPRPTRLVRIAGQLPNVAPPRTQLHPPSPPPPPSARQLHVRLVDDREHEH